MITIEHWPEERWPDGELAIKASTFIRHNRKRVDPWFARYCQGKEPPNYPMPAIPLEAKWYPQRTTHIKTLCVIRNAFNGFAYDAWWAQ